MPYRDIAFELHSARGGLMVAIPKTDNHGYKIP
jgi:hypothetical protein